MKYGVKVKWDGGRKPSTTYYRRLKSLGMTSKDCYAETDREFIAYTAAVYAIEDGASAATVRFFDDIGVPYIEKYMVRKSDNIIEYTAGFLDKDGNPIRVEQVLGHLTD